MDSNLDSILSGQSATEEVQQEPQAVETQQVEQQPTEEVQDTGEQAAGSPPEQQQKEDPLETHRKGLEAAATAERKKRQAAEQQLAQLRQELEALRQPQQVQQPVQQEAQDDDPKPLRAHFETEDEWLDARDSWRDRQRERASQAEAARRQEDELRAKVETVIAEAMTMEGFDLQAFSRVPVSQPMMDAILDSDAPAKLVHFLQSNPEEAKRISAMPDARQIKELARIEDKLAAPVQAEEEDSPAKPKPQLPNTLTQARDTRGRFESKGYDGPTPLNAILK